jgi:hypothetical protein
MAPRRLQVSRPDHALVAAVPAGNEQAPHAMPAHAAECHGTDWFIIPGHAGKLRTHSERNQVRSPRVIRRAGQEMGERGYALIP